MTDKNADREAIAEELRLWLDVPMQVRVARKRERLGVLLEAEDLPDCALAVGAGQQVLAQVQERGLRGLRVVRVYGRQVGQESPAWCWVFPVPMSNAEKLYGYFVAEAEELLQSLERDLLSLRTEYGLAKVHSLLLGVHTIKGGSASVGLQTIAKVAHGLEDVFAALRHRETMMDAELETLLVQGFECLRRPLVAQFAGEVVDEAAVLDGAAAVMALLQTKLGDCFERETPLLTAAELGFDVVQNLFQISVAQRLGEWERSLFQTDLQVLATVVREKAEVFLGLAESMGLPGFGAIAQTTLRALEVNPERVMEIAKVALADFAQGRSAVLGGDRAQGGAPSLTLQSLTLQSVVEPLALDEELEQSGAMPNVNRDMLSLDLPIWDDGLDASVSLDDVFGQFALRD
jgi:HPt (histidine-containing phosphotransfer) domain-containing protein